MKQPSTFGLVAGLILPFAPAPPAGAGGFSEPETWARDFGHERGWRVGRHLRVMGDVDGDGRADIVGFGETGVFVALSTGRSFTAPEAWVDNYSYNQGWRVDRHPRYLADVDADGRLDIVGFGENGVFVSLSTGAAFRPPSLWLDDYSASKGWNRDRHLRLVADVDGDRRPDLVGFGDDGVYVSLARAGRFARPALWTGAYGHAQGWREGRHPRVLADVDGDGRSDVVGFAASGVMVARAAGDRFTEPRRWAQEFGHDQGWRAGRNPRVVVDIDGDGRADILGFADAGTVFARARDNEFGAPERVLAEFGRDQGWREDRHLRLLADVDGDDRVDVVGFGDAGVFVATSRRTALARPVLAVRDFGHAQGWRVDAHVRVLADVNGDGADDIIGFGDRGVRVALAEP